MRKKEVIGFENYIVYEDGRVFSKVRNKFLKPRTRGQKRRLYQVVALYDGTGIRKNVSVHRLVAEHFIPNTNAKPIVNHKDNDTFNNDISNLEWATATENTMHSYNETNRGRGFKSVLQIDKKSGIVIKEFESLKEAQEVTGIHYTSISKVANGVGKSAGGYVWRFERRD